MPLAYATLRSSFLVAPRAAGELGRSVAEKGMVALPGANMRKLPTIAATVFLTALGFAARADQAPLPPAPDLRRLLLDPPDGYMFDRLPVADGHRAAYVWVVTAWPAPRADETPVRGVFRSLRASALRQWVSHLPAGRRHVYFRFGRDAVGGPAKSMPLPAVVSAEMEDFHSFCRGEGVTYLIRF